MIAAFSGCAIVVLVEDISYAATGVVFWNTGRFHPISVFLGTLTFLISLYVLQRLNDSKRALRYLQPYTPLLGASSANLALKLNSLWLLPVILLSIVWSVSQVRAFHAPSQ